MGGIRISDIRKRTKEAVDKGQEVPAEWIAAEEEVKRSRKVNGKRRSTLKSGQHDDDMTGKDRDGPAAVNVSLPLVDQADASGGAGHSAPAEAADGTRGRILKGQKRLAPLSRLPESTLDSHKRVKTLDVG